MQQGRRSPEEAGRLFLGRGLLIKSNRPAHAACLEFAAATNTDDLVWLSRLAANLLLMAEEGGATFT